MPQIIKTPFGAVKVEMDGEMLCRVVLLAQIEPSDVQDASEAEKKLVNKVHEYCQDPRTAWTVKTQEEGTEFQKRVWAAIREIPFGETKTYQQLAEQLGSSPRAVGTACGKNPLPLLTPCHRVVSKSGLGGFSGQTEGAMLRIKEWLLANEAKFKRGISQVA